MKDEDIADALTRHGIDPERAEDILDGTVILYDAGYPPEKAAAMMIATAKQQQGSVVPMAEKIIRIRDVLKETKRQ